MSSGEDTPIEVFTNLGESLCQWAGLVDYDGNLTATQEQLEAFADAVQHSSIPDACRTIAEGIDSEPAEVCRQCGLPRGEHPAGDGVTECPGDFGPDLPRILRWKDEDEIDGVPIGPGAIYHGDELVADLGWIPKPDAIKLAAARGATFEES